MEEISIFLFPSMMKRCFHICRDSENFKILEDLCIYFQFNSSRLFVVIYQLQILIASHILQLSLYTVEWNAPYYMIWTFNLVLYPASMWNKREDPYPELRQFPQWPERRRGATKAWSTRITPVHIQHRVTLLKQTTVAQRTDTQMHPVCFSHQSHSPFLPKFWVQLIFIYQSIFSAFTNFSKECITGGTIGFQSHHILLVTYLKSIMSVEIESVAPQCSDETAHKPRSQGGKLNSTFRASDNQQINEQTVVCEQKHNCAGLSIIDVIFHVFILFISCFCWHPKDLPRTKYWPTYSIYTENGNYWLT